MRQARPGRPARRTTVLLIEDCDSDAEHLDRLLQGAATGEFDVTRASTLAEAMSSLKTKTPDCAVVDLKLTDAEAVEIVESLAALPSAVALIVLIGHEGDELRVPDIVSGAIDYVAKGGLGGELLARCIHHAIERTTFESSLAEAQNIARLGSWEMDVATHEVSWSRELYRICGYRLDQIPNEAALIDLTHPGDQDASRRALRDATEGGVPFIVEHRIVAQGTVRWVRSRGRVELDSTGRPARLLGTVQDITGQKAAEAALVYQAFHDPLTGLPNRLLLLDRLTQALRRLARQSSTVGVVHLDVDRFKMINDSLGHPVGDQLLLELATRLTGLIRPGDTLARIGGDEFVVLCEGLTGQAEAVIVTDRICAAMADPLVWDGGQVVLSVSAGIALATSASTDAAALLRDADSAMYAAKAEGRARSAVFAETMRARAIGRLDTEMSLRRSIGNGDLRVYYQPIVNLASPQVLGYEALVRWEHPTRGLLGPDSFITIAEETGLIVPLGAWVLREACKQAKRFQARDPMWSHLTMSVNLSGGQLDQRGLVALIASALQDADLRPDHLQLEMTESVLMDDAANTITILANLKDLGVHLGVDDFGTGYSSLAYLKRFPVDIIKIDRSFVSGLEQRLDDSAIVAAIASLADTLGLVTIAEGVETGAQRDLLIGLGCARAQGYLFARPMAAADAERALDSVARLGMARPVGLAHDSPQYVGLPDQSSDRIAPQPERSVLTGRTDRTSSPSHGQRHVHHGGFNG